ncbi:MAG TPA: hypothetical protein DD435_06405 [Cyanobacteria bacterium UBA8530]|nr:hypothetical protein [Cyanobacteria bacterium UBA8530]
MTQIARVQSPMVYGRPLRTANANLAKVAAAPQTAQTAKTQSVAAASINDLIDAGDDKQAVYAQQMKRWFMGSPSTVLFMNASPFMRSISSFLTGVPKEDLKEFAYRADLMRVPGMSPDVVRTIRNPLLKDMINIKGPGDLGSSSIGDILRFATMLGAGGDLASASAVMERARGMQNKVS